jgi:hypothetical protein
MTKNDFQPLDMPIYMKKDLYCQPFHILSSSSQNNNNLERFIRDQYKYNDWIVDQLLSRVQQQFMAKRRHWPQHSSVVQPVKTQRSSKQQPIKWQQIRPEDEQEELKTMFFYGKGPRGQGLHIGFVDYSDTEQVAIHNHFNVELEYTRDPTKNDHYHIVRFTVQAFSIQHDFAIQEDHIVSTVMSNHDDQQHQHILPRFVKMLNPIPSCQPNATEHTTYDMVHAPGRHPHHLLVSDGHADLSVLFTYDVIWTENSNMTWESRWQDRQTARNELDSFTTDLRWSNIPNSVMILVVLTGIIIVIWRRHQRGGIYLHVNNNANNNHDTNTERHEPRVTPNVIMRSPRFAPLLLAAFCGAGAQILITSLIVLVLLAFGIFQSHHPGSLVTTELLLLSQQAVAMVS